MRIYVDTGVLLANIIANDPNHVKAQSLLRKFTNSEFIVSEISIIEMLSVLSRNLDLIEIEGINLKVSSTSIVKAIVLLALKKINAKVQTRKEKLISYKLGKYNMQISLTYIGAIELSRKIKLRTLDLLHIAFAKQLNAEIFLTLDKEILKKANVITEETQIKVIGSD